MKKRLKICLIILSVICFLLVLFVMRNRYYYNRGLKTNSVYIHETSDCCSCCSPGQECASVCCPCK